MDFKPLGEHVRELGYASLEEVQEALALQGSWRRRAASPKAWRLGRVLLKLGLCDAEQVARAVARQAGVPYVRLEVYDADITDEVVDLVPYDLSRVYGVAPIRLRDERLIVATSEPLTSHGPDDLRFLLGLEVGPVLCCSEEALHAFQGRRYGVRAPTPGLEDLLSSGALLLGQALLAGSDVVRVELGEQGVRVEGVWAGASHVHELPLPRGTHSTLFERAGLSEVLAGAALAPDKSLHATVLQDRDLLLMAQRLRGSQGSQTLVLDPL